MRTIRICALGCPRTTAHAQECKVNYFRYREQLGSEAGSGRGDTHERHADYS